MTAWLALIPALLAAIALGVGVFIEHDQRSSSGPVAIVPTLPHAFAAAILAAIAVLFLRAAGQSSVAWWHAAIAFVLALVGGVGLIVAVGNRAERRR